jgi:hypothetical protein
MILLFCAQGGRGKVSVLSPESVRGKRCLELGCGIGGLPGLACSRIGESRFMCASCARADCTCLHEYIYTCIFVCVCVLVCICVFVCIYVFMHLCIYTANTTPYTYIYTYIHV